MEITPFVPTRIDEAPSVYRGCTLMELVTMAGVSLGFYAVLCLFIGFVIMSGLTGLVIGLAIALLLTLATVWIGMHVLQMIKRGRPVGYHGVLFRMKLHRKDYIVQTEIWDVGRTRYHGRS